MRRTLYVDGFNFYYGVTSYWSKRDKLLAGLGWCNFRTLIERHFPDSGKLLIKYFTAPVTQNVETPSHPPGEHKRYTEWMRSLRTIGDVVVIKGFYKPDYKENADAASKTREEKQTDVSLAVEMLVDASAPAELRPGHVFMLSGDCDLMPAIFALQERALFRPRLTVLLPSESNKHEWEARYSQTRRTLIECHFAGKPPNGLSKPVEVKVLDEPMLASSLLDYSLRDSEGDFSCPPYWKLPSAYLEQHSATLGRGWVRPHH